MQVKQVIIQPPVNQGLYNKRNEKDACGVGFVVHIKGKKSHEIIAQGLTLLTNLTHRGATGYDPKLGDGAGLLMQMPDAFMPMSKPAGPLRKSKPLWMPRTRMFSSVLCAKNQMPRPIRPSASSW